MIVFTTKLTRRKVVSAILVICILICSCIVYFRDTDANEILSVSDEDRTALVELKLKTNKDRISLLQNYGWEVAEEPLEIMEVRIPQEFDGVYEEYGELQEKQGLDLKKYSGKKAIRYTYKVNNYDGEEEVVANIIVFKNKLIAGDICSPQMGGFMHGLNEASKADSIEEKNESKEEKIE